jgi:hypothetical protein
MLTSFVTGIDAAQVFALADCHGTRLEPAPAASDAASPRCCTLKSNRRCPRDAIGMNVLEPLLLAFIVAHFGEPTAS